MSISHNIITIGFKSCGKSTVGKLLAQRLDYTFADLDDTIQAIFKDQYQIQWSCWEFYAFYGDAKFREVEAQALGSHVDDVQTILATGGGAPLTGENRALLSQLGTVCYIKAEPDVIFERFRKNEKMPAYLEPNPTLDQLRPIWEKRHQVYSTLADITIEAGRMSPAEITDILVERINAGK